VEAAPPDAGSGVIVPTARALRHARARGSDGCAHAPWRAAHSRAAALRMCVRAALPFVLRARGHTRTRT
jgi:hypothetical protein